MSRVNGHSDQSVTAPAVPAAANLAATEGTTTDLDEGAGASKSASESTEAVSPAPQKPRSAPPDLTKNLASMRDLANSSARTAIDKSARQKRNRTTIRITALSLTVFVLGSRLVVGLQNSLLIAGAVGVAVGVAALLWRSRHSRYLTGITRLLTKWLDRPLSARRHGTPNGGSAATDDAARIEAADTLDDA